MKAILLTIGLVGGAVVVGRNLYGRVTSTGPEPTVSYYSDGTYKSSAVFVDGLKEGASKAWHANGKQESEGDYEDGLREGAWMFWHADGTLDTERSGEYREGQRHGALGAR
jgi:antitoxin component YwqK of YwqJK toxin-antitoxin module